MTTSTSRQPLDQSLLQSLLDASAERAAGDAPRWRLEVVDETGSTNADVISAAAGAAAEGLVRVAEFQHGGRGRLDRTWVSPAGAGLTFSMLIRPVVALSQWSWLPLLTGVALAETVEAAGVPSSLKWPNDLLVGPEQRKVAGILLQLGPASPAVPTGPAAAVVGVGLNVSTTNGELPVQTATSLVLQGGEMTDRGRLLVDFLGRFAASYRSWQAADGNAQLSGLAQQYHDRCATLGNVVNVELPGEVVRGTAVDIDDEGRLLVAAANDGAPPRAIAAGDVTHLRSDSR
ncbi:biotin--[acetyl-CoA-carboxylase] ligase [Jatrophihabitans sp. DSM 45814]